MVTTTSDRPPPPRRRLRRIVVVATLIVGMLAGAMAAAPTVFTPLLARRLSAATGADARIGWISWNPLRGRVVLHRLALAPARGTPAVVTAQALVVDVALRRWLQHGERQLDAIVLRRPWVALRRTGPGDFDLAALFPALGADGSAPTPPGAEEEMGPPTPVRIGLFRILNGSVEFRDETITPALETSLYLDDASARDLVLASDGTAGLAFHVESRIEDEPLTLDVSYDTGTDSSQLTATLVAADASLARALLYVPLGWQRTAGTMHATVTYERRVERNVLRKHGLTAELALHDLALTEPWAKEPMLRARRVRVPTLAVDLLKQRTDLGAIQVDDYHALVLRDDEQLHVPLASGSPSAQPSSWTTTLDRVALGKGTATLRNVLATPEVIVPLTNGTIRLPPDAVAFSFAGTLAGGRFSLDGNTRGTTTTLSFGLDGLDLVEAAPIAGVPMRFAKGRLTGTVDLSLTESRQTFRGVLSMIDTCTAPVAPHPEEVIAWQRLDVTIAESQIEPLRVHLPEATAVWPYVMVHRRTDGIFPFTMGTSSTSATPAVANATVDTPWLRLDHLAVDGGRIEFYDSTLPKAYGIDLTDLKVSADGIALAPLGTERLVLHGAFDELSPLEVLGRIHPGGTTLTARVDRLLLPPLNPYLAPALGYEVRSGLARVASTIRLDGSKLSADTDLVLSRFAMRAAGTDTVEARIGTPLSVALALMKDTRGDIHLDLPIEGDVASAEYRVGSLLREALGTSLLGTIRGPLGFLRGIFRKDEGERFDLRPVPFPPGSAALGSEGEERIAELARLLGRQTALRAVLIPAPSLVDFEHVTAAGAGHPLDVLAGLARDRAAAVRERLTTASAIAPERVTVETWTPVEPDIEGDPGVDVQLRAE